MFQLSDSKLALMFWGYHEINGIGKSTCQNLCFFSLFFFFFHCWRVGRVGAASAPCLSRVGAVSAPCRRIEKKKKKRDTAGHRNPARRTRSGVDTCRTRTQRQKWRVRATQLMRIGIPCAVWHSSTEYWNNVRTPKSKCMVDSVKY